MNDDLRARYLAALRDIAPDLPEGYIDPQADLLEEYDLDSMDLLNLVATLSERFAGPGGEGLELAASLLGTGGAAGGTEG